MRVNANKNVQIESQINPSKLFLISTFTPSNLDKNSDLYLNLNKFCKLKKCYKYHLFGVSETFWVLQ